MGNQTSQDFIGKKKARSIFGSTPSSGSPRSSSTEGHGSAIEEIRPTVDRPPFTQRQKDLVLKTWQILHDDMARVGVVMFIG